MQMWQILIPTTTPEGKPIRTRFHRVWDEKVRTLTGGLTILRPSKGIWTNPSVGDIYCERMIPVLIKCDSDTIDQIIDISLKYYRQQAIMAYKVSDDVIVRHSHD